MSKRITTEPEFYLAHWRQFEQYCEKRAKDADCHISNKNWQRLKEFHLKQYLRGIPNKFGWLFNIKIRHQYIFQDVRCMNRIYYKYLQKQKEEIQSNFSNLSEFTRYKYKIKL